MPNNIAEGDNVLVNLPKNGDMKSKELILVSHQGGKGFGPENTLESLSRALDFGVEMIETDVRMSGDGVPFIHHSPFLGLHLLGNMAMAEIRDRAPEIPTLEGYLDLACDKCSISLDIKRCHASLIAEIISLASPAFPILVSSFEADFLKEFKKTGSRAELGLLTQYEPALDRLIKEAAGCGATTLLPVSFSVRESLVDAAHDAGLRVIAWTVNTTSQLENMIAAGVDGVITDFYRELEEFLKSGAPQPEAGSVPLLDNGLILI